MRIRPEPNYAQIYGLMGHLVRRELSLRNHEVLKGVRNANMPLMKLEELFMSELMRIEKEVPVIYGNRLLDFFNGDISATTTAKEILARVCREVEPEICAFARRAKCIMDELGVCGTRLATLVSPWRVELSLKSKSLGLSGRIDKVEKVEAGLAPVEIKTGKPPAYVWPEDVMQLAAYAILLEEKFGGSTHFGFVEYTRTYERRPVMLGEREKRDVLRLRNEVLSFLSEPESLIAGFRKNPNKCQGCSISLQCSSFFR